MVATLTACQEVDRPAAELDFLELLPAIRRVASYAFRHLRGAAREDLMAEVIANSFAAFRRLVDRGNAELVYPAVLATFAVRQVREGRRLGSKLNIHDVLSPYAKQRKRFHVRPILLHFAWISGLGCAGSIAASGPLRFGSRPVNRPLRQLATLA
jgi:hypothetical protein